MRGDPPRTGASHDYRHPSAAPIGAPSNREILSPAGREILIAQYIGCILNGVPYPEELRPLPPATYSPASAAEGLARIVGLVS